MASPRGCAAPILGDPHSIHGHLTTFLVKSQAENAPTPQNKGFSDVSGFKVQKLARNRAFWGLRRQNWHFSGPMQIFPARAEISGNFCTSVAESVRQSLIFGAVMPFWSKRDRKWLKTLIFGSKIGPKILPPGSKIPENQGGQESRGRPTPGVNLNGFG